MKVKQLIARLSELDPEEDIFQLDGEYGPEPIETVVQELHHVTSEKGRELPKMVWCIE